MITDQKYTGNVSLSPVGRKVEHMSLTADQEIRARALEAAVEYMAIVGSRAATGTAEEFDGALWRLAKQFEDYIRNGK